MKVFGMLAVTVLCAVLLCPPSLAQAQLGLRLGGVNTSVVSSEVQSGDPRFGPSFGVFVDVHLQPGLTARPEFSVTWKGGDAIRTIDDDDITADVIVAELPVLLRYRAALGGRFAPSVYGGPYLGIIVRERIRDGGFFDPWARDFEAGFMIGVDMALLRGGGLFFDSRQREFGIGARYTHGLTDLAVQERIVIHSRSIGLALFLHL